MPFLQYAVQRGRRLIPRGWSRILKLLANIDPRLQAYPATLVNGDVLYVNLAESMCHGYFYHGCLEHEQYTEAFFRLALFPGSRVYDIGANIGYFTRIASKIVGNHGHVHAFEPMPSAIRLLQKNIADLRNVAIHALAVSDSNGSARFVVRATGDTSSLGEAESGSQQIEVATTRLDDHCRLTERIDLIKVDVEGYELEVLRGAIKSIAAHHPILYFEYIEAYARLRGIGLDEFRQLLEPLGYELHWINAHFPHGPLISTNPSSYLIGAHTTTWPDLLTRSRCAELGPPTPSVRP